MTAEKSRRALNFEEKKGQMVKFLQSPDNAVMVLGTSCDDRVLVRNVLTVSDGHDIYFFTWRHSRKGEQIERNHKVALCKDDVQIEGIAEILGGFDEEHTKRYTDLIRSKFPDAIERWERRPSMVIVRVKPTFAALGGSDDPPELEFLDLVQGIAYAEPWACY
jgi:general stress protein 26